MHHLHLSELPDLKIRFALVLIVLGFKASIAGTIPDLQSYRIGDVLHRATVENPVVVLISRFHAPNQNYAILQPTIDALLKAFGPENLQVEVFRGGVVEPQAADLILTSSGAYRRHAHLGTRDLATLVSEAAPDPNAAEASSFVVRADRTDLRTLNDLRGRVLAATSPYSFGGYQIGAHELYLNGLDHETMFSDRLWVSSMPQALNAVLDGRADVCIVRACVLEELASSGVDISALRVLHENPNSSLACRASTAAFPNWTFYATSRATPEIARKAASVLLGMKPVAGNLYWTIATDFTKIDHLFYDLKIGPYEYRRHWTFDQFWENYRDWVVLLLLIFAGIALHSWRSDALLTKRTTELKQLGRQAQTISEQLANLQRIGIIGQISTIVAHELRHPLSSCVNYLHGLERLLEQKRATPEITKLAFVQLRKELDNMDAIVSRVRSYAKNESKPREIVDFSSTVKNASEDLLRIGVFKSVLIVSVDDGLFTNANPLEMRLIAVNLIKNALQATDGLSDGKVYVRVRRAEDMIELSVRDNGPQLSAENFCRILEPLRSSKMEGLGLGLTITRLIVENHGGTLQVKQLPLGGLLFTVRLPSASLTVPNKNS